MHLCTNRLGPAGYQVMCVDPVFDSPIRVASTLMMIRESSSSEEKTTFFPSIPGLNAVVVTLTRPRPVRRRTAITAVHFKLRTAELADYGGL